MIWDWIFFFFCLNLLIENKKYFFFFQIINQSQIKLNNIKKWLLKRTNLINIPDRTKKKIEIETLKFLKTRWVKKKKNAKTFIFIL